MRRDDLRPAKSFGPQVHPPRESDVAKAMSGRRSDPVLDRAKAALPEVMAGAAPRVDRLDLAVSAATAKGSLFDPHRNKTKLRTFIDERQRDAVKSDKRARRGVSRSQLAAALMKQYPTSRDREIFLASRTFAALSAGSQETIERLFIEFELADAPDDDVYEGSEDGGIWAIQAGIEAEDAAFDAQGEDDEDEDDEEDEEDEGWGYAS